MATYVEELLVRLDATTEDLKRSLASGGLDLDRFANKANLAASKVNESFTGIGGGLEKLRLAMGAAVAALGGAELFSKFHEALTAAAELGEMAKQMGISTDLLQGLQYAAVQSGVSVEELQTSIARFSRNVGAATEGNKGAIDSFNRLGVGILDFQGKLRPTDQILNDVAIRLSEIEDPARRASIAAELFGRSGQRLLTLLDRPGGFDEFIKQAKAAGVVLDENLIESAHGAASAIAALGYKFDSLWQKIAAGLAGPATGVVDFFNAMLTQGDAVTQGLGGGPSEINLISQRIVGLREKLRELNADVASYKADGEETKAKEIGDQAAIATKQLATLEAQLAKLLNTHFAADKGEQGRRGLLPLTPLGKLATSNPPPTATGETEAEKQAKKLGDLINDLNAQLDTFDLSPVEKKIATTLANVNPNLAGAKDQILQITQALRGLDDLQRAQNEDKRESAEIDSIIADLSAGHSRDLEEAKNIYEDTFTPFEKLMETEGRYLTLLQGGIITQGTYNKAVKGAEDAYYGATDAAEAFRQGTQDAFQTLQSDVVDSILNIRTLDDAMTALASTAQDLAKVFLSSAFSQVGGQASSWFMKLFSSNYGVGGDIFDELIPQLAGGGVMTDKGLVPLRKYAGGGIARGPQAAIIAEGGDPEAYVPVPNGRIPVELSLNGMAARGGGAGGGQITVNGPLVQLNAQGGSEEQNNDLADKTARRVQGMLKELTLATIRDEKRSGGMLA